MPISRSARAACVVVLTTVGTAALTANATDLFIGGTVGEVYVGDSRTGGFEIFGGICLGPVQALALDDVGIYAGDLNGGIVSFDLETGDFLNVFFVPDAVTAMVMHDQDLLISDPQGNIRRVDPPTGTIESTLSSGIAILAMLIDGDDLYVAGPIGVLYKGDAVTGDFELFGSACLGPIHGLAMDDENIYAGDETGAVLRFDLGTGKFLGVIDMPASVTAMAWDDVLLVSDDARHIRRVDPISGTILATLESPIDVQAMQLLVGPCLGDVDGNGRVDLADLLAILRAWGPCKGCREDLNGNGVVEVADILILLAAWGPCPS